MHAGSGNKRKKKKNANNNNNNTENNSQSIITVEKMPTELTKRDNELFGFHWKYGQETSCLFCWIHITHSLPTQTHLQCDISLFAYCQLSLTSHFCHSISLSLSLCACFPLFFLCSELSKAFLELFHISIERQFIYIGNKDFWLLCISVGFLAANERAFLTIHILF